MKSDTTVNMTRTNEKIEVVTVTEQRRRRWSTQKKAGLVRLAYEPSTSVSLVARQHGVAASQLFSWCKLNREGALVAVASGESVMSVSDLANARAQIVQFQQLLGKKTMENEILKKAVELTRERKWIARSPLCGMDDQ
jgi:transposase